MALEQKQEVIYTCMFGYSETLADIDISDDSFDYVCFTDDAYFRSNTWQIRYIGRSILDPARFSKRFKHLPAYVLPEYKRSLYIDNTVRLKAPPRDIFNEFADAAWAMLPHYCRDCVYQEAEAVISAEYDDATIVRTQMQVYRDYAYPEHNGLHSGSFLLRNHNDAAVKHLCNEWHSQLLRHSKRDQLSLDFCAWFLKYHFTTISQNVKDNDLFEWPVNGERMPRDFNDQIYLTLHPDVAATGMNPRIHYRDFGRAEGRQYKRVEITT